MTTKSELPEQMPERIWIPRDQMHEGWFSILPQGDTFVAYRADTPTGQG